MRIWPGLSAAMSMLLLSGPAPQPAQGQAAGTADEASFLRAAGDHFGFPYGELEVLRRWGLSAADIPVVLFLTGRAGVSPDVVVTQRRRGESWMAIARAYGLHAGNFHVQLDGPHGALAGVYNRFSDRPASEWRELSLSDDEVVGLVNVSFMARALRVSPDRAARELDRGGGMVGAFMRLRGGDGP